MKSINQSINRAVFSAATTIDAFMLTPAILDEALINVVLALIMPLSDLQSKSNQYKILYIGALEIPACTGTNDRLHR